MAIIQTPKILTKAVGRALVDFAMLKDGDKVLLAVSGGKDSLSLLHLLLHFKRHSPVNFSLSVVTVDPQIKGFNPQQLSEYLSMLKVENFLLAFPMENSAKEKMRKGSSYCSYCARVKRSLMYSFARDNNFNVLALGHHLDDLVESLFMSMFYNGKLQTMKANYLNDAGDVRVIRPLAYVRERQLRAFAVQANLPVINENCPACFSKPTKRAYCKKLLLKEEKNNTALYKNLLTAMMPLLQK